MRTFKEFKTEIEFKKALDVIESKTGNNYLHMVIDRVSRLENLKLEDTNDYTKSISASCTSKAKLLYTMNFAGYTPFSYLLSTKFLDINLKSYCTKEMLCNGASLFEATKLESAKKGYKEMLLNNTILRGCPKYDLYFTSDVLLSAFFIGMGAQARAVRLESFPKRLTKVVEILERDEPLKSTDIIHVKIFGIVKQQRIKMMKKKIASVSQLSEDDGLELSPQAQASVDRINTAEVTTVSNQPSLSSSILSGLASSLNVISIFKSNSSGANTSVTNVANALSKKNVADRSTMLMKKPKKYSRDDWYDTYSKLSHISKTVVGNEGTCKVADEFFAKEIRVLYDIYNNITTQRPASNFKELVWLTDMCFLGSIQNTIMFLYKEVFASGSVYIIHRLLRNGFDFTNCDLSYKYKTLCHFSFSDNSSVCEKRFFKALLIFGIDPNAEEKYQEDLLHKYIKFDVTYTSEFLERGRTDIVISLIAAGFDVRKIHYSTEYDRDLITYSEDNFLNFRAINMIRQSLYPEGHLEEIRSRHI